MVVQHLIALMFTSVQMSLTPLPHCLFAPQLFPYLANNSDKTLALIVSDQTNDPLQVDCPEIYYSLDGCSIKVITPFEIGEEGCHIYLDILHRYAGFEKIYPRVISRN